MSFGFSVGDFLIAASLIYEVCEALSDAHGSSVRYKEFASELEGAQRTLGAVKELVEASKLLPEEAEDARQAAIDYQHSIETFFLLSAKYNIMKEPAWPLKVRL